MLLGNEDGPVELTSVRKISTGDEVGVVSEPRASVSTPTTGSEDGKAEKSIAAENPTESGPEEKQSSTEGEERGEREKGEITARSKPGGGKLEIQRPESMEIDDQLCPKTERNPRKSVLRKREPTPVHTGPTYTSTSPVGEPYDSNGQKRSSTSAARECCSVM